ncbi:DUF305 domain-containing protein [Kibdelosporangium phytohabitans]|uniref:DUF305 domain-containing protein n=1 Tax=Kibdelosporangium phytohabitans TaxID=860235 RepID=A0A0N9I677_9PSEU|nr:DUF305 domain-containing protein [Kibdelosporangium phytohabitans]ALG11454.1 hypothetical protein AOZ06_35400 [Kibdelosporangium phytohabitans]MBE1462794.1 uncharacterized protein (DUF305 family) [Kibdelosporangium phytohabitans]
MSATVRRRVVLAVAAVVLVGIGALGGVLLTPRSEPGGHPVDIGFSQDMIVHHQQAVDMAELLRGRASPQISSIAAGIAANQRKEIGLFQGWLSLWNAPQVPTGHSHGDGAPMPGMVSIPDLHRLEDASGTDLDILFLQLMVRHHQGGARMADAAARTAHQQQVRDLAKVISADQQREIATMTGILASLGSVPLPAPQ